MRESASISPGSAAGEIQLTADCELLVNRSSRSF